MKSGESMQVMFNTGFSKEHEQCSINQRDGVGLCTEVFFLEVGFPSENEQNNTVSRHAKLYASQPRVTHARYWC
ncbi:MAG: hypothetical protein ACSLEL_04175 [Candidatus Malihini olakiniferum]